jgi:hypothetical protein
MMTIARLGKRLQWLLGERADELGRETSFVQRQSKLSGGTFSQTTVFGWLAKPDGSLNELSQTAASLGVQVSAQGLDERFGPNSAELLRRVLLEAVEEMVQSDPVAIGILQRFAGVHLLDSTTILLPDEWMEVWPGCGPIKGKAALKVMVDWDWLSGGMKLQLMTGRTHDQNNELAARLLPAGHLRLMDVGFLNLNRFQHMTEAGNFWLSRFKAGLLLYRNLASPACTITHLLNTTPLDEVEYDVWLGLADRVPCRLVARRLSQTTAEERLRKLHQQAQREGRTPSADQLTLACWTVLITNIPTPLLTPSEALVLYRVRWQIELLFKLWKSGARLETSRSANPWRILTELFAKLLGVLIQHWLILIGCWHCPHRSLTKAGQTIRKFAFALALSFAHLPLLCRVLEVIQFTLSSAAHLNSRLTHPNTVQLLLALA